MAVVMAVSVMTAGMLNRLGSMIWENTKSSPSDGGPSRRLSMAASRAARRSGSSAEAPVARARSSHTSGSGPTDCAETRYWNSMARAQSSTASSSCDSRRSASRCVNTSEPRPIATAARISPSLILVLVV